MKLQYKRHQIPLEVMDTPNKRNQGMMGRKNLQGGMLFIFPHIQELSFWMKNCLISLDIIFIIDNNITHIERNAPPCTNTHCPNYVGIGNKVVELPAGMVEKMGVEKGDEVLFI